MRSSVIAPQSNRIFNESSYFFLFRITSNNPIPWLGRGKKRVFSMYVSLESFKEEEGEEGETRGEKSPVANQNLFEEGKICCMQ